MKVSVQWLRELVDVDLPVDQLAPALTMGGIEVEEIHPVAPGFSGVVVAQVKRVSPHPNADKLRVTEVDAGTGETLTIVCGAPNVAEGQKVPCALVGAKLPAEEGKPPFEIKKAKLRGVDSSGMLCSARELGLADDHSGLLVLDPGAPVGRDVREVLALDDVYLTLKLTPNRGDCLSMTGIARDAAAITRTRLRPVERAIVKPSIDEARSISIQEPKACGLYCGRMIRALDAAAKTPDWIVRRIERSGLRAISPLVDITNYVMLELGQPMHAFDAAKLKGAIGVRYLVAGEKVKLLNDDVVGFRPGLLAITDESGPIALGGVMGGHDTMVGPGTTDVFFEAAFFAPEAVQGRARDLGLTSDAAYRFERGVDFGATRLALERATQLTLEICGGRAGPITEARGELPARKPVRVRPERVRRLLGYAIDDVEMGSILRRLSCDVREAAPAIEATAPTWRFDLTIEEDFVEEIARIRGYEHVPSTPPRSSVPMLALREGERDRFDLRHRLADLGFQEVVNYSFVAEEWERDFGSGATTPVRLANPIAATMGVMRTTLLGALMQTLRGNLNRDIARVRIFEIGRCFEGEAAESSVQPERIAAMSFASRLPEQWAEKSPRVDFYDAKGDLEALAKPVALEFVAGVHPACHPGRCAFVLAGGKPIGFVGELHPRLQQKYELATPPVLFEVLTEPLLAGDFPRFQGVSRMPVVRRDYAFTVAEEVPAAAILRAVRGSVPPYVREVEVFDMYRGKGVEPGQKSLALRIVMQDTDRTLTDSEVEGVVASVRDQLHEKFQARPRT